MAAASDDILKAIEVATEAYVKSIMFDAQIIEDKLKYSNWLTGLAVGYFAIFAPNYAQFKPSSFVLTPLQFLTIFGLIVVFLLTCLMLGGYYHWLSIKILHLKRERMTLSLRQYSAMLSELHRPVQNETLYQEVWDMKHLDPNGIVELVYLEGRERKSNFKLDWFLAAQVASIVLAIIVTFGLIFVRVFHS